MFTPGLTRNLTSTFRALPAPVPRDTDTCLPLILKDTWSKGATTNSALSIWTLSGNFKLPAKKHEPLEESGNLSPARQIHFASPKSAGSAFSDRMLS